MAKPTDDSPRTDDTPTPRCPICGGPDLFGNPCQSEKAKTKKSGR